MIWLVLVSLAVAICALAWLAQGWLVRAFRSYRSSFQQQARDRLEEFFLFLDPGQLWAANLVSCGGLVAALYVLTGNVWLVLLVGVAMLCAPRLILRRLRRKRLARFDEQLPDLLLSLAGALRAGSGIQSGLRHLVVQSPAPLAQEFGLMLREQRMGVPFEQALAQLYRRMPSEGMGLLASALNIALQSGGNLAETLERIATTLRARLHLLGRVHALTSQGRLQAWIMAALPFFLALALEWLDPSSMALLWHTPAGWGVLATVAGLELIGVFLIRRIVNIQV
ncbi:type II secretion system F family protein [Eoetvoesiella caeni]